jgi:hypothetical protein
LDDKTLNRQLALVSYGNKYLRHELTLEAMFRHGVFFGHRLLFRTPDNLLLADDFTLWLGILRELGARRLSLHRAAECDIKAPHAQSGGKLALAVHYADRYELWACDEEQAAWWTHPALPQGGYQYGSECPPAAGYGGDIDSYWCLQERPGQLPVPETDWRALAKAIETDLQLKPDGKGRKAFFANAHDVPEWANFPLFPYANARPLPHQLIAMLTRAQAQFANDSNGKNENSYYYHLSGQALDDMDNWGKRLDVWLVDVALRCANEFRLEDALAKPYKPVAEPLVAPLSAKAQARRDKRDALTLAIGKGAADPDQYPDKASEAEPDNLWFKAAVFAMIAGLFSLLLLAVCNLIALHSWLALVLAVPCAMYVYAGGTKED